MLNVKCRKCGKRYDDFEFDCCPRCGTYNRAPERMKTDGSEEKPAGAKRRKITLHSLVKRAPLLGLLVFAASFPLNRIIPGAAGVIGLAGYLTIWIGLFISRILPEKRRAKDDGEAAGRLPVGFSVMRAAASVVFLALLLLISAAFLAPVVTIAEEMGARVDPIFERYVDFWINDVLNGILSFTEQNGAALHIIWTLIMAVAIGGAVVTVLLFLCAIFIGLTDDSSGDPLIAIRSPAVKRFRDRFAAKFKQLLDRLTRQERAPKRIVYEQRYEREQDSAGDSARNLYVPARRKQEDAASKQKKPGGGLQKTLAYLCLFGLAMLVLAVVINDAEYALAGPLGGIGFLTVVLTGLGMARLHSAGAQKRIADEEYEEYEAYDEDDDEDEDEDEE